MATPDVLTDALIATRHWSDYFSDDDFSDDDFSDEDEDGLSQEGVELSNHWTVLASAQECGCSCSSRALSSSCTCYEDDTPIDSTKLKSRTEVLTPYINVLGQDSNGDFCEEQDVYHTPRHHCFQNKMLKRQQKRRLIESISSNFEMCIQEHQEIQDDIFYDAIQGAKAAVYLPRSSLLKSPLQRHYKGQWLLFYSALVFCWFDNKVQDRADVDSLRDLLRQVATNETIEKGEEDHVSAVSEVKDEDGLSEELVDTFGSTAKWLKWEKTRSEIFGVDVVPWEEGWAFHFIFCSSAGAKQSYLSDYVAQGRHIEWGMGVLPIPGDWKRRQRAKQRQRRAEAKRVSNTASPCHQRRDFFNDHGNSSKCIQSLGLHCEPGLLFPRPQEINIPNDSDSVSHFHLQSLRGGGVEEGMASSSSQGEKQSVPEPVKEYEFRFGDFRNDTFEIKPRQLTIRWVASDAVPELIRQSTVQPYQAVETNGDGACAIHSVFGRPGPNKELFASGARDLAVHFLRMLPEAAVNNEAAAQALISIHTSFWNEFAQPLLRNEASDEGRLFWKALLLTSPGLAAEARQCAQISMDSNRIANNAKQEALSAARRFFVVANEETCIRSIAIQSGYLDATTQVEIGSNGQVSVNTALEYASLCEGMQSARDNNGFVRGTRVLFPRGGPECKYAALFDPRPVFDSLRATFMGYADPSSQAILFLRRLQEQGAEDTNSGFFTKVRRWIDTATPVGEPSDFGVRAWSAYLICVQESSYFFSIDELLAICTQAAVRAIVLQDIAGSLKFAGGCLHGQGPLILTKLNANNEGRVRSHFERLIPTSLALHFSNTIQEEERSRLRDEAKLRREKEAIEAKALAEKMRIEKEEVKLRLEKEAIEAKALTETRRIEKEAEAQQASNDFPPPPPPHESGRPNKKRRPQNMQQSQDEGVEVPEAEGLDRDAEGLGQYVVRCLPCHQSNDPRANLEKDLLELSMQLRNHPTVPASSSKPTEPLQEVFQDDVAPLLPPKHCAFKSCSWVLEWGTPEHVQTERDRENILFKHIMHAHAHSIEPAANGLPRCYSKEERFASAYNEAIGIKVRQGAPLASYAIDRKCLRKASAAMSGNRVEALICFFCACIYPHMQGQRNQNIEYHSPLDKEKKLFFQWEKKDAQHLLSLETYLQKYGKDIDGFFDLEHHRHEFDDWLVNIPFKDGSVQVLCCPEDRRCSPACLEGDVLCPECEVPVCNPCLARMRADPPSLPAASLCNDMMIFYAPEELYEDGGLTIMEMICASPCLTSMICFSMEVKYGNMFDSTLHMQRHRVGARGNATTFLLPWESLLVELQRLESTAVQNDAPLDLPRSGKDLAYVVQVLLKTNDEDERDNLKNFVFQAQVNRKKVVNLILSMKRRGHKAFMRVDEQAVREKAMQLPEQGVPPELISLLPNDSSFDKLRMQKAATPVEGMKATLAEAGSCVGAERPNAVVLARSALEEGDLKIRREEAIRTLVDSLSGTPCDQSPSLHSVNEDDIGANPKRRRMVTQSKLSEKSLTGILVRQCIIQLSASMLSSQDLRPYFCTSMHAGHCTSVEQAVPDYERSLRQRLRDFSDGNHMHSRRFAMSSGSVMQPQFKPWYFGVAFAFLFKFCVGMPDMPDWSEHPRHRRDKAAPRVDFSLWVKIITRRVEQQLKRDWLLGFTMGNVLFRSMLNQCKTVYSYEKIRRADGSKGFTGAELESGAISICQALDGKYKDLAGKIKKVNGDFTKVRYAINLNEAGKRLLQNLEHTSRQLKGTMEVRKLMRYDTNASRIRRGVPIFVTFSPDEKHNVLMLKMHRSRRHDPIHKLDPKGQSFGERQLPPIDSDYVEMKVSCEQMLQWLPSYDDRRAILSRDGLASVEGFRITILLVCEYLFGMRVCPKCPDCNQTEGFECQDLFGNNAYSDGGVLGRADGIYISIEAQKSAGSLHAHGQLHIECLHQHNPLLEVMSLIENGRHGLVAEYLRYKKHVCREEYEDPAAWKDRRLLTESDWPEYKHSVDLVSSRSYLLSDEDGKSWLNRYLNEHVQTIQELKQNHVHTLNAKGERVPLAHCRRAENPNKCKSDFPRTLWLIRKAVVLCKGLMKIMGMPSGGRRNRMGSLHGPRNDEDLNGAHPAMCAFLQTNSDIQLPYRFAITKRTHDDSICSEHCYDYINAAEIIQSFQCCQDAQIGYTCDYQNKRAARSCNEVKECVKGHRRLHSSLHDKRPEYIGKRQVIRLCSDAYGKGTVRSNQESINLRIGGTDDNVTSAESFHTASCVNFPGRDLTMWREAVYENADYVDMLGAICVDRRNPQRKTPIMRNLVFLYGHRNADCPAIWHLSPYEFLVYWTIAPAEYPMSSDEEDDASFHATLTKTGKAKLEKQAAGGVAQKLLPGTDYEIKDKILDSDDWMALPKNVYTEDYRHDWILQRNCRPCDPSFAHCPMPRRGVDEKDRNASILLTYFHPFTLNPDNADGDVPFLGNLCEAGLTWNESLLKWFDGRVACQETKRYVDNFLAVTRTRPDDEAGERSDDDFSDEELEISAHNFSEILKTRMGTGTERQRTQMQEDGQNDSPEEPKVPEMTKVAFASAHSMWQIPKDAATMDRALPSEVSSEDLDKALKAAAASQRKEFTNAAAEGAPRDASLRSASGYTAKDIWKWFDKKRKEKNLKGQPMVKAAQLEMLRIVCQRICDELEDNFAAEPLLWTLHGIPGTGKSEVLQMVKELFRDVCGWQMGMEFQMVALQAVMAQMLEGDTIHHALGINPFGNKADPKSAQKGSQRQTEVANRVMHWRWLFIDEISMVGAKLLAEVDMKLRSIMSDVETMKKGLRGQVRAFGGINVVFVGDFWQLDPPSGGFLGAIPAEFLRRGRKYDPKPDIAHGQAIFWGSGEGCVQGLTELTECVRTEDPWLLQVQLEMRDGALSQDSWDFLHGQETSVPGSCVNGKLACGNKKCWNTWKTKREECATCNKERLEKHRVMNSSDDHRHREGNFLTAPAIFPNNDIKFEVNKIRAQIFAKATKQAITWSIAKDKPSNKVIAEKENLAEEKKVWLTRHDRDSGSLYGVLPLAIGLPVMLTDHYDRNPEKQLLRGRIGYVKSWVLDDREDSVYEDNARYLRYPPKAVLVQYFERVKVNGTMVERPCKWKIDGMSEPGVYPIKPWPRSWALDQRRDVPQLWVKRWQVPLAPAYAITAHGSQGQTLRAAIIDLQIGRGVSPIASYVCFTRIKMRGDMLIFRSFDRAVFTNGPPEGPSLLLKKLRGEDIDWQAIEDMHTPSARCRGPCMAVRFKDSFFEKEWKNKEDPHCKDCIKRLREQGKTHRCARCKQWSTRDAFIQQATAVKAHICGECKQRQGLRRCMQCEQEKPESQFEATRWNQVLKRRICLPCSGGRRCQSCHSRGGFEKFAPEEWEKTDEERRCKECVPKLCCKCRKAKVKSLYVQAQWALGEGKAVCNDCDRKRCGRCNQAKSHKDFEPNMWELADGSAAYSCRECTRGCRMTGMWTCANRRCRMQKAHSEFSEVIAKKGKKVRGDSRQCNDCVQRREAEEADQSRQSAQQVQKKPRKK